MLLPYLEQDNIYARINFNKDIADPSNAVARTTSMPVFLCPSDNGDRTFFGPSPAAAPVLVAHSNYAGIFGNPEITPDPGFLLPASTNPERSIAHRGMFYRNTAISTDVTDGTSNTLFVGERCSNLAYATWTGAVTGSQVPPRNPDPYGWGPEGRQFWFSVTPGTIRTSRPTRPTARSITSMTSGVGIPRAPIFSWSTAPCGRSTTQSIRRSGGHSGQGPAARVSTSGDY